MRRRKFDAEKAAFFAYKLARVPRGAPVGIADSPIDTAKREALQRVINERYGMFTTVEFVKVLEAARDFRSAPKQCMPYQLRFEDKKDPVRGFVRDIQETADTIKVLLTQCLVKVGKKKEAKYEATEDRTFTLFKQDATLWKYTLERPPMNGVVAIAVKRGSEVLLRILLLPPNHSKWESPYSYSSAPQEAKAAATEAVAKA